MHYLLQSGETQLSIEKNQQEIRIDGQLVAYEILSAQADTVQFKVNNQLYRLEILKRPEEESGWLVRLNGKVLEVALKSELDLMLEKFAGASGQQGGAKLVKAPMPGLIVKLTVSQGDTVSKGQVLLNFEAMKMENQLKSPGNGKVKTILVSPGDKVEKGQVLVELE
jgi:biotin carboxyl carrier protein